MHAQDLQQIELTIEEATNYVKDAEAVERLLKNRDFKRVILEGYFKEEAIRLAHLKSAPGMQTPERQSNLEREIRTIGTFKQHLDYLLNRGDMAKDAIRENEETRKELIQEIESGDYE